MKVSFYQSLMWEEKKNKSPESNSIFFYELQSIKEEELINAEENSDKNIKLSEWFVKQSKKPPQKRKLFFDQSIEILQQFLKRNQTISQPSEEKAPLNKVDYRLKSKAILVSYTNHLSSKVKLLKNKGKRQKLNNINQCSLACDFYHFKKWMSQELEEIFIQSLKATYNIQSRPITASELIGLYDAVVKENISRNSYNKKLGKRLGVKYEDNFSEIFPTSVTKLPKSHLSHKILKDVAQAYLTLKGQPLIIETLASKYPSINWNDSQVEMLVKFILKYMLVLNINGPLVRMFQGRSIQFAIAELTEEKLQNFICKLTDEKIRRRILLGFATKEPLPLSFLLAVVPMIVQHEDQPEQYADNDSESVF